MKTLKIPFAILALLLICSTTSQAQIKLLDSLRAIKKSIEQIKLPDLKDAQLPMEFGDTLYGNSSYNAAQISEDGKTVLLGFNRPKKDHNTNVFQAYYYVNNRWEKRGKELVVAENGTIFRGSYCMSADGNWLVIGSPQNDGDNALTGKTLVYKWNGLKWTLHQTLEGEQAQDGFGSYISYYPTQNLVFISAPYHDIENGNNVGQYKVYSFTDDGLVQKGSPIVGRTENLPPRRHEFFYIKGVSEDGNTILLGNPQYGIRFKDETGYTLSRGWPTGCVATVIWKNNDWEYLEDELCGRFDFNNADCFGSKVQLYSKGKNLFVLALPYTARTETTQYLDIYGKVFEWNDEKKEWGNEILLNKENLGLDTLTALKVKNDTLYAFEKEKLHRFVIVDGKPLNTNNTGLAKSESQKAAWAIFQPFDGWEHDKYDRYTYYHPNLCVRFLKKGVGDKSKQIVVFYNKIQQ
ncbi:MAG: hypothetical protein KDC92_01565 [Bacteroidetes bacterium]|nr:hypothetical protein [Bacteroidota bacterium]